MSDTLERIIKATGASSDKELAIILKLSPKSISKARNLQKVPDSWIPKVASIYNISTDWLFFGTGSMRVGETASQPQNTLETPTTQESRQACARCAKLESQLEAANEEIRAQNAEIRTLNAELRKASEEAGARMGELQARTEELLRAKGEINDLTIVTGQLREQLVHEKNRADDLRNNARANGVA